MRSFWSHGAAVVEGEQIADFERGFKHLYMLRHPDAPRVKVGVSGDLLNRIATYPNAWGTGLAAEPIIVPARLLWLLGANEARDFEQWVLSHFKAHRLRGEWLALVPEVEAFLSLAERANDGVTDEKAWDGVLTPLAKAVAWPVTRFRFKVNENGDTLLAFGETSPGQSRRFRRLHYSPSRGVSPKV